MFSLKKLTLRQEKILILVLAVCLFVAVLRIPSLFEPHWYRDEGISLTVAQTIHKGAVLYKDIFDNKTPLFYFLLAAVPTLFGIKLLTFFWVMTATVCFTLLTCKLLPFKEAVVSSSLFALFTSLPFLEGNIVNGEILFIMPIIAAILLLFKNGFKGTIILAAAGFLCGLAFMIKVPSVMDFGAILLFVAFESQGTFKQLVKKEVLLAAGFLLPLLAFALYFALHRALGDFLTTAFAGNFGYVGYASKLIIPQGWLILKSLLLAVVLIFLWLKRKSLSPSVLFAIVWLLCSLFGALLSGRLYVHYILQVIPPLCLCLGFGIIHEKRIYPIVGVILAIVVLLSVFPFNIGSIKYQESYYRNFVLYAVGKKSLGQYYRFFDPQVLPNYNVAAYLNGRLQPNEPLLIWGDEPPLYSLLNHPPVGKYCAAYHVSMENSYTEVLAALEAEKTRYILMVQPVHFAFPQLEQYLQDKYHQVAHIDNVVIFERGAILPYAAKTVRYACETEKVKSTILQDTDHE